MSFDRNTASLAEYSSKGHIFQALYHLGSSERNKHSVTRLFRHFYFWGVPKEMNTGGLNTTSTAIICALVLEQEPNCLDTFTFGEFPKK